MITGQNPALATSLLLEQWNRLGYGRQRTWVDAGYCIDAPQEICAGSTIRAQFGSNEDEWLDMTSFFERG